MIIHRYGKIPANTKSKKQIFLVCLDYNLPEIKAFKASKVHLSIALVGSVQVIRITTC